MPDETRLRQRIARVELLAPHRHLVGRNFRGRDYELFRLSALLDGDRAKPLLVQGIGGSGKSALIGRFLLDRHQGNGPWAPFVFLDFDRSMLAAEEPITLMTEAVRQLGAQFPELTGVATRLITSWEKKLDRARAPQPGQTRSSVPRGLARYSLDETDRAEIRCEALRFLRRLLLPGDRLLLVLDTFEEVQIRSSDAVDSFWKFLDELLDDVPGLRIVVSGRAELKDRHVQELPLGDLEPKAAVEVVVAGGVPSDVAAKVVELVGGNPLCLQLALQVLHREGLEALDGLAASDLAVAGAIRSEIVERWLYRRILGHVHDKEVAKLAWPGLAVRLIDPQVIREVLAEPCGLHVPDDAVAHDLFERLSSEVTLVQQRRVGTLYHRPDVRRLMLAQLRTDALDQFDAINRKAAEFYRAKTAGQTTIDLEARAEEIYHRLALGEPLGTVEPLWVDGVEEFLYNAVEDFTAVEPATFLASRLHVELPQDLWDQARIEDWELQAARRAQDLLALNEPTKALAVLTSRPERSSGSPLYLLEARLRLQQGEDDAAIHLARAAIHKAAAANKDSTCLDLLLFLGDALWRRGDLNAARVSLGEAIAVAKRLPDPRHAIDALMQYLRLGRMRNYGGVPSADDAAWRAELGMRLKRLTRSALYSVPVLMQQAAAEASSEDAEAFRFVAQVVGSRIKEALVLYPRVAPPDRLRVWLGAWAATAAPTLNWFLNGAPVIPTELRSLASVRPDAMLPPGVAPEELQRAFAGVYEFAGLIPDTLYTIAVQTDNQSATLKTRTLPSAVPTGLDRWLNVLLVSCFHQAENHQGLAGTIVSQLPAVAKPHLTVLAGDQVSLDLPTLKDFPDDLAWLAEKFEKDYTLNWRGPRGYAEILRAAPSLAIPGDHEYWNNFPHPSPFIGNSLTPDGRNRWREAAQAMYAGFQLPYPAQMGEPVRFEVEPLSFFVADTRSHRDAERCFTMSDEAHHRMEQWVSDTIAKKQFGVFVSGQSLFTKATSKIAGGAGDYKLPNYGDYGRILLCLRRLADAGRPTLCLTGDMPLGRVLRAMDIRTGRTAYTEIIASPVSLVPTPGQDPIREVGAFSSGLCGSNNPWPPHFDPDDPPAFLASEVLQRRFPCATQHQQKGNHVVLLSFRQHGSGIEVRIKYWPITRNALVAQASEIGPITLLGA
jgi:hypothetical protein